MESALNKGGTKAFDEKRREYLAAYESLVGRPLVVYAADMLHSGKVDQPLDISVSPYDKDGWVEVTDGLPDGPLDLLLHSPGGSPFAAEWLVNFLRRRFNPIRAIVPHSAKSAATMIALACNELLMDERGELGPIDPQMNVGRPAPAQAILDQFAKAQSELADKPTQLPAWVPILQLMGPSLLVESENAISLSKQLVRDWLEQYMFAGESDAGPKAAELSEWLGNHNNFGAHGRIVSIDDLKQRHARVLDLRDPENSALRQQIWTIWSAYTVTFDMTGAFKIFESSRGPRFFRSVQRMLIGPDGAPAKPGPIGTTPKPDPVEARRRRQGLR